MSGDEDHRQLGIQRLNLLHRLQAGNIRQHDVQQDNVDALPNQGQPVGHLLGRADFDGRPLERPRNHVQDGPIVVNHQ
jgi:hypothetical protein